MYLQYVGRQIDNISSFNIFTMRPKSWKSHIVQLYADGIYILVHALCYCCCFLAKKSEKWQKTALRSQLKSQNLSVSPNNCGCDMAVLVNQLYADGIYMPHASWYQNLLFFGKKMMANDKKQSNFVVFLCD